MSTSTPDLFGPESERLATSQDLTPFAPGTERLSLYAYMNAAQKEYARSVADQIAAEKVAAALANRQANEDKRANRRNRNRLITMGVAIVGALCAPTICLTFGISIAYVAFVTILPDTFVTIYAFIRKY